MDRLNRDSFWVEDNRLIGSRIPDHDLRYQAVVWALYKGCSIWNIMDAQSWSSSTTFPLVYLNPRLTEPILVTQLIKGVATTPSDVQNEPPYYIYFGTNNKLRVSSKH